MPHEADIPTIYHIEGSRAFRVIWLCEELGIPYELVFKRGDPAASMATLRTVHPLLPMAPVVRYGGELIVESGAILEILLTRHGKGRLVPAADSADFLFHVQWLHFAEATVMSRMLTERFVAMASGMDVDKMPKGYTVGMDVTAPAMIGSTAVFGYVDDFLSKHAFFGGAEFTAADIMMEHALRVAKLVVWADTNDYQHIKAWRKRVAARPAYECAARAATPGGADEYGLPIATGHPLMRPSTSVS
ncbi:MAG: glutathione S-transferase family protein [Steroidobacteraceae bacterium]